MLNSVLVKDVFLAADGNAGQLVAGLSGVSFKSVGKVAGTVVLQLDVARVRMAERGGLRAPFVGGRTSDGDARQVVALGAVAADLVQQRLHVGSVRYGAVYGLV